MLHVACCIKTRVHFFRRMVMTCGMARACATAHTTRRFVVANLIPFTTVEKMHVPHLVCAAKEMLQRATQCKAWSAARFARRWRRTGWTESCADSEGMRCPRARAPEEQSWSEATSDADMRREDPRDLFLTIYGSGLGGRPSRELYPRHYLKSPSELPNHSMSNVNPRTRIPM